MKRHRRLNKRMPVLSTEQAARFWSKVKRGCEDECWDWIASLESGYGRVGFAPYGLFKANRIAYFLSTGIDPGEMGVLHKCDRPQCCNPSHLILGTDSDNNATRAEKGRSRHHIVDCTRKNFRPQTVRVIRNSTLSQLALSRKYNVNRNTIRNIQARITYKHVA